MVSGVYRHCLDGSLYYMGVRPGAGFHAHGYCFKDIIYLKHGHIVKLRVFKRRWLCYKTGHTCHSRPPDDASASYFCTLIILLKLWRWLNTGGLHTSSEVLDTLEGIGSNRSMQRWMKRILPHGLLFQQAIRRVLIERSEPQPMERLFPVGLSPPEHLVRRHWHNLPGVLTVWRGATMLMYGARALNTDVAIILAEARGRWDSPQENQVF